MKRDESQNVEYKRSWHDDYLRWVCGFANGKGSLVQELDILNVPSDRRNGILADVFGRLDYMEREGSGFKKIMEDYSVETVHNTAMVMPKFYSAVGCFIVTLPRLAHSGERDTQGEVTTPITTPIATPITTPNAILELIRKNSRVSATQMAKLLGLTRDGVRYHLGRMKAAGVIHFVGSARTGHWEVD